MGLPQYQSPKVERGHWLFFFLLTCHLNPFVLGPPPLYLVWGGWVVGGTLLKDRNFFFLLFFFFFFKLVTNNNLYVQRGNYMVFRIIRQVKF